MNPLNAHVNGQPVNGAPIQGGNAAPFQLTGFTGTVTDEQCQPVSYTHLTLPTNREV